MNAPDALKAYEEAALRCRSKMNGGACVCAPKCSDVCYVEAEASEIDGCTLAKERAAREAT